MGVIDELRTRLREKPFDIETAIRHAERQKDGNEITHLWGHAIEMHVKEIATELAIKPLNEKDKLFVEENEGTHYSQMIGNKQMRFAPGNTSMGCEIFEIINKYETRPLAEYDLISVSSGIVIEVKYRSPRDKIKSQHARNKAIRYNTVRIINGILEKRAILLDLIPNDFIYILAVNKELYKSLISWKEMGNPLYDYLKQGEQLMEVNVGEKQKKEFVDYLVATGKYSMSWSHGKKANGKDETATPDNNQGNDDKRCKGNEKNNDKRCKGNGNENKENYGKKQEGNQRNKNRDDYEKTVVLGWEITFPKST